jgi:dipeptidyl aminopeptidase/acylaminoacyl peptidase
MPPFRVRLLTLPAACAAAAVLAAQAPGPVTVDDLMQLRTVLDVRIAPDGSQVAYVVSTPSIESNSHRAEIFVVSTRGGPPTRIAEDARVFVPALPAARLRWHPDGRRVSFLGVAESRPQVMAAPANGGPSVAVTAAPQGVITYEWSPDGVRLAYLSRDAAPRQPVIRAGATADPATRLWVQTGDSRARVLTTANQYVDGLSWSTDGREIVYSAASVTGFTAPYYTRIHAIAPDGTRPRVIVDRGGRTRRRNLPPTGDRSRL